MKTAEEVRKIAIANSQSDIDKIMDMIITAAECGKFSVVLYDIKNADYYILNEMGYATDSYLDCGKNITKISWS